MLGLSFILIFKSLSCSGNIVYLNSTFIFLWIRIKLIDNHTKHKIQTATFIF